MDEDIEHGIILKQNKKKKEETRKFIGSSNIRCLNDLNGKYEELLFFLKSLFHQVNEQNLNLLSVQHHQDPY